MLIHLEFDAETQLERIRGRGRDVEKTISLDFLNALNTSVIKQVDEVKEKARIITIDSARKNFAHDEAVRKEVLQLIINTISEIQSCWP